MQAFVAYMYATLPVPEVTMKKPEEMTLEEIRVELRTMGVTEKLVTLVAREMDAAEQRAKSQRGAGKAYDPLRAQLYVLKANGMTNPDLSLNRKGTLFVTLVTRQQFESAA